VPASCTPQEITPRQDEPVLVMKTGENWFGSDAMSGRKLVVGRSWHGQRCGLGIPGARLAWGSDCDCNEAPTRAGWSYDDGDPRRSVGRLPVLIWSGSNKWSALARHMLASDRSTTAPQFS
jgi:hypothetical protein